MKWASPLDIPGVYAQFFCPGLLPHPPRQLLIFYSSSARFFINQIFIVVREILFIFIMVEMLIRRFSNFLQQIFSILPNFLPLRKLILYSLGFLCNLHKRLFIFHRRKKYLSVILHKTLEAG